MDYEVRREDIPKVLHLYQEWKNCQRPPEETDEVKDSSDNSEEDIDVVSIDTDTVDSASNLSEQCSTRYELKSNSSCSSLTIHACTYESCDKFFSKPSRLAQHLRTHTGERPFVCPAENCSRSYARQQHLKRHMETSHQEKEKTTSEKFKCALCGKMLSNIYALRKHVNVHHVAKKYDCGECGQSFKKQQHLQSHSFTHTGIKPYLCDHPGCEMRCLTPSVLNRHKLTHQKNRYVCPQESCQEKFDVYKDLQIHIASHPKECDICGLSLKTLRSLKKHRLTHESHVEAFFCTYPACNKYYYQMNNLKTHIKEKHTNTRIYECGVCERRLASKQKLILHMKIHSPSYKRSYTSEKPRKARKDKGCSRLDYAKLLSGYSSDKEEEYHTTQSMEPDTIPEKNTCAGQSLDTCNQEPPQSKKMKTVPEKNTCVGSSLDACNQELPQSMQRETIPATVTGGRQSLGDSMKPESEKKSRDEGGKSRILSSLDNGFKSKSREKKERFELEFSQF